MSVDERPAAEITDAALFDASPIAMLVLAQQARVRAANPAANHLLLGDEPALLAGRVLGDFLPVDQALDLRPGSVEVRLRQPSGHELWARLTMAQVELAGEPCLLACVEDSTTQHTRERLLLHAALHDSLTNLPNRRMLRDRLDTAMSRARRTGSTVAVLFIDLDRFKDINDTLGHEAGDEVLLAVGTRIHGVIRAHDLVARLGGDEFVVVCEDTDAADVTRLAQRLVQQLEAPISLQHHEVRVSASIGVALDHGGTGSADALLHQADLAMFRAKHSSQASFTVDDGTVTDHVITTSATVDDVAGELRHAVQANELLLHYQPVIRVDGLVVGLEALLRWRHPRRGLLLPGEFLPAAVRTDLARPVTDWVLRTAIRDAASWPDPPLRVSVNVWASEAARPGFAETVRLLLEWAGLPARNLYLELHEQGLQDAGPGLALELHQVRQLGVGLALDDAQSLGVTIASFRRLPVNAIKVDRSFVAGVPHNPEDTAVVAAVAAAARASGRLALATGVETVQQLSALTAMGYRTLQGYLAAAPAPLEELATTLTTRRIDLSMLEGRDQPGSGQP